MFKETELSYTSGNENSKGLLIFQEVIFRGLKMLLAQGLKNVLYFRRYITKPENQKFFTLPIKRRKIF